MNRLDLEPEDTKKRKAAAAAVMQKIGKREKDAARNKDGDNTRDAPTEELVLNSYEQIIASEVVAPEDIAVKFDGEI